MVLWDFMAGSLDLRTPFTTLILLIRNISHSHLGSIFPHMFTTAWNCSLCLANEANRKLWDYISFLFSVNSLCSFVYSKKADAWLTPWVLRVIHWNYKSTCHSTEQQAVNKFWKKHGVCKPIGCRLWEVLNQRRRANQWANIFLI